MMLLAALALQSGAVPAEAQASEAPSASTADAQTPTPDPVAAEILRLGV